MQIIANREIDLSDYTPEDLEFVYPRGAQLSIELSDIGVVSVQGHNALSDTYYMLPIVEKLSYDVLKQTKKAGIYEVDITSVDRVKLIVDSGKGKMYVKVIGR